MADLPPYPLEQVLSVKKSRVEKAEKLVEEKTRALDIEQEKLKRITAERDEVRHHEQEKQDQMRTELDAGTTSDKILQMKAYLKIVGEKLQKVEQRLQQQKQLKDQAETALNAAKEELRLRRMEAEKIRLHREEWEKEARQEITRVETREYDELGQLTYEAHKRQQKNR